MRLIIYFLMVSSGPMGNNNKEFLPLSARVIGIDGCIMERKPPTPAKQFLGAPFLSSVSRGQVVNWTSTPTWKEQGSALPFLCQELEEPVIPESLSKIQSLIMQYPKCPGFN